MEITTALAADLAILSETFAPADDNIVEALRELATSAKVAVRSYLGLTVVAANAKFPLTLTAMEDAAHSVDVTSSLMMPLYDDHFDDTNLRLVVILYAGSPGAFVDLATDLRRLTGRQLTDFALDQHLTPPAEPDTRSRVQATSFVNQAIGALLGHGYTPEQAEIEIDARAAAAGHSRCDAAQVILSRPDESGDSILWGLSD